MGKLRNSASIAPLGVWLRMMYNRGGFHSRSAFREINLLGEMGVRSLRDWTRMIKSGSGMAIMMELR